MQRDFSGGRRHYSAFHDSSAFTFHVARRTRRLFRAIFVDVISKPPSSRGIDDFDARAWPGRQRRKFPRRQVS